MTSWLSFPLPNPFKSTHDNDDHPFSIFTQTITDQLRGVATFLAPPPLPPDSEEDSLSSPSSSLSSSSQTILGIKNDLFEIGGSLKTSLSGFASNLLQFEGDQNDVVVEEEAVVGITEQVIHFVREISVRPECWIDFPLSIDKAFDMSDVQKDHAATIEHSIPSLTALRHKIKSYLSEEQFWMIYFILLIPRLNEDDSKLLSTPEIVEAREILLRKLKNKKNSPVEILEEPEARSSSEEGREVNITEGMQNSSQVAELPAENINAKQRLETQDHGNSKKWRVEEHVDTCTSEDTYKHVEDEDDVSFSDLEDDDNDLSGRLSGVSRAEGNKVFSQSESNDWVQLTENSGFSAGEQKEGQSNFWERHSEGEESNDWLTVDDVDLES